MLRSIRRSGEGRDAGSALVVALAVAVIGLGLATVVVSQAIIVMHGASQDRLRTVEIHTAEGALDATFKVLETSTPCLTTISVGQAPQAVVVTVSISYYTATSPFPLTCTNGTLSAGTPVKAVLTSSSVPAAGDNVTGIQRKIQANVNLVPQTQPSFGAAIFAGGDLGASGNGIISPLDLNFPAQVWINAPGTWMCSNPYTIDGDVIVPSGSANITCEIKGNVWVAKDFQIQNPGKIDKNLTLYSGNLQASNSPYFGGNVSVGNSLNDGKGQISDVWSWTHGVTVMGSVCTTTTAIIGSHPCTTLPLYAPRVLPEVDYNWSDWQAAGFTSQKRATGPVSFATDVVTGAGLTAARTTAYLQNPCHLDQHVNNPVVLTNAKTVYDLRGDTGSGGCPGDGSFSTSQGITFVINADTVFFVNSFNSSNQLLIKSGDGQPHSVWIIVPDGGTKANGIAECTLRAPDTTYVTPGYQPGDITFSNQSQIAPPIELFAYTPCNQYISNQTAIRGQIYGHNITTSNNFHLLYAGIGIPGVNLGGTPTTTSGFSVEIVNKHEIQN